MKYITLILLVFDKCFINRLALPHIDTGGSQMKGNTVKTNNIQSEHLLDRCELPKQF